MRIYSATDVGQKRKMNQDYVFVSQEPVGNLPNLFAVADGMGGHNAGDYASAHAVQTLVSQIQAQRMPLGIPMNRVFLLPALLSNIRLLGPVRLCRPIKVSAI